MSQLDDASLEYIHNGVRNPTRSELLEANYTGPAKTCAECVIASPDNDWVFFTVGPSMIHPSSQSEESPIETCVLHGLNAFESKMAETYARLAPTMTNEARTAISQGLVSFFRVRRFNEPLTSALPLPATLAEFLRDRSGLATQSRAVQIDIAAILARPRLLEELKTLASGWDRARSTDSGSRIMSRTDLEISNPPIPSSLLKASEGKDWYPTDLPILKLSAPVAKPS